MNNRLAIYTFTASDNAIASIPSGKYWVVKSIVVANTDATARTFRLHHAPANEASSVQNALHYDVRLAANSTISLLDEGVQLWLIEGESLRGLASAASVVTIHVYGEERSG